MMKIISTDEILYCAKMVAMLAHRGQKDKAGADYDLHLGRVANNCKSKDAKIVAWLHDIAEDKHVTHLELWQMGFLKKKHLDALALLDKSTYTDDTYYERVKRNKLATEVKIADLKDNMDMARFIDAGIELTEKHWDRFKKYKAYLDFLEN